MAASHYWDVTLDKASDDLGTSLMPEELHVAGNAVEYLVGNGKTRTIRLRNAVNNLACADITIKRALADYSVEPPIRLVSVERHQGAYAKDTPPW